MKLLSSIILLVLSYLCSAQQANYSFFTGNPGGACVSDNQVELGMKFTTSTGGTVTHIRYYKCTASSLQYNTKLYHGSTVVATAPFGTTQVGWITVPISPQHIDPGVTFTVSYWTNAGGYQSVANFPWPVQTGPLTATAGVYRYGNNSNTLPTLNAGRNYYVDIIFKPDAPPMTHDTVIVYRDTGQIIHHNVYIYDTIKIQMPPAYVYHQDTLWNVWDNTKYVPPIYIYHQDTLYVPMTPLDYKMKGASEGSNSVTYLHDTIYQNTKDTDHTIITYSGMDTLHYNLPHYHDMKVTEFIAFDGEKYRYRHYIVEAIKQEWWDKKLKQWTEVQQGK